MKVKALTVNGVEVTFDSNSLQGMIKTLAFFDSLPRHCGICQQRVIFGHRKAETSEGTQVDYYQLTCTENPRHQCKIGEHMHGKGMFCRGLWEEYVPRDQQQEQAQPAQQQQAPPLTQVQVQPAQQQQAPAEQAPPDDDIPF